MRTSSIHPLLIRLGAIGLLAIGGGCGDELGFSGEPLVADPAYFATQRFSCTPTGSELACPPYVCSVDETGRVFDCSPDCAPDRASTAFEYVGVEGFSLCVPDRCQVEDEGVAPICSGRCAEDHVTTYEFYFRCD